VSLVLAITPGVSKEVDKVSTASKLFCTQADRHTPGAKSPVDFTKVL